MKVMSTNIYHTPMRCPSTFYVQGFGDRAKHSRYSHWPHKDSSLVGKGRCMLKSHRCDGYFEKSSAGSRGNVEQ